MEEGSNQTRQREKVVLCWCEMTAGWPQVEQLHCSVLCFLITVFLVFYLSLLSTYYNLPIK